MRILLSFVLVLLFASCGEAEHADVTDSVHDDTTVVYSSVLEKAQAWVPEIAIPFILRPDSLPEEKGLRLDEQECTKLLLPGFDYAGYKRVYCVGKSTIAGMRALWIKLLSTPEYDGSPFATDILMVLYNEQGEPVDVYNAASSDASYYISSCVRTDSVFTLEQSEMEDINITTTAIGISKSGFMPQASVSKTFKGNQAGSDASNAYIQQYFDAHLSQR